MEYEVEMEWEAAGMDWLNGSGGGKEMEVE